MLIFLYILHISTLNMNMNLLHKTELYTWDSLKNIWNYHSLQSSPKNIYAISLNSHQSLQYGCTKLGHIEDGISKSCNC